MSKIAGRRIGKDNFELSLIAVKDLHCQLFAVGGPERPGNILVNAVICFYPIVLAVVISAIPILTFGFGSPGFG